MTVLFISDLHLDAGRPETLARFDEFIERRALAAREVYILGDLFEAWIGDDDDDRRLRPVIAGLQRLTEAGIPAAVMHGNRDFLIGKDFCEATGCRLLTEYERVDMYGETVLLTHGDLLCTDDIRYMTLRATLRDPTWQSEFLAKPLSERRVIAADLRKLSATEIAAKAEDIMDVNQRRSKRPCGVSACGSCCMGIRTGRPCTASRWTVMPLSASCSAPGTSKAASSRGTRLVFA